MAILADVPSIFVVDNQFRRLVADEFPRALDCMRLPNMQAKRGLTAT